MIWSFLILAMVSSCSPTYPLRAPAGQGPNILGGAARSHARATAELRARCGDAYVEWVEGLQESIEERLHQAGFTATHRALVASGLLMGNTSGSRRYLTAMGITPAEEQEYRSLFLSYTRQTPMQLSRKDDYDIQANGLVYDGFLRDQRIAHEPGYFQLCNPSR